MKKLMAAILSLVLLSAMALPAMAQGRNRYDESQSSARRYDNYRDNSDSYPQREYYDYGYDNRSFWDQHRDKLTTVIGALGGALVGSAVGGSKGAAIGALAGAGGAALYTYKIRDRYHY